MIVSHTHGCSAVVQAGHVYSQSMRIILVASLRADATPKTRIVSLKRCRVLTDAMLIEPQDACTGEYHDAPNTCTHLRPDTSDTGRTHFAFVRPDDPNPLFHSGKKGYTRWCLILFYVSHTHVPSSCEGVLEEPALELLVEKVLLSKSMAMASSPPLSSALM